MGKYLKYQSFWKKFRWG